MELERLEVVIDGNTGSFEEKIDQLSAKLDGMFNRIKGTSQQGADGVERNLTRDTGFKKMEQNLEKLNGNLEKVFKKMETTSKDSGEKIGAGLSSGVKSQTIKMTKDVQTAVDKVNLKMQQARMAQQKVANLTSDRNGAQVSGNPKSASTFDGKIAQAQLQMNRAQKDAQAIVRQLKAEYDAIPGSLKDIEKEMMSNEGRITSMRQKLKQLKAEMKASQSETGSFSSGKWVGTGVEETPKSIKIKDTITKQEAAMQKLVANSDQLQKTYAQMEDRSGTLKDALEKVNTELGETATKTKMASNGMQNLSGQSGKATSLFRRFGVATKSGFGKFGGLFKRNSDQVTKGTGQMNRGMGMLGQTGRQLFSSLIIFGLLSRGIMALASGFGKMLSTNQQFANSLNQIKVNLLTAFYPIYTAILPAINALMNALVTVTGYLASFIAMIFGTTYSAAKQGAKGIQTQVDALQDTGTAMDKTKDKAKKLQQMLMGFDEINTLTFDDGSDDNSSDSGSSKGPGGIDWSGAEPETPAWDAQGKKVMDAWKYATGEIWGLVKSIGSSFLDVWTNGTGQKFVENLLILLADALNIIGDIAGAFRRAWDDGGRGTAVIQSIFDMWNAILGLLHQIAAAFRTAWNDGLGESIAANLFEIFTNINNTVANLANRFSEAWQAGSVGESIFRTILGIFDGLLGNLNGMTKATADWAKTLNFTPLLTSIDGLLKSIQPLTKNIGDGLEWFYKNVLLPLAGFTIQSLIPAFIDLLRGALDLLNGVIEALKPLFMWLWDNMLKPIAEWTGGVIVEVLKSLADVLTTLGNWMKEHKEVIQGVATVLLSLAAAWGIVKGVMAIAAVISTIIQVVTILKTLISTVGIIQTAVTLLAPVVGAISAPFLAVVAAVAAVIAIGVLLWQNWDTVKEKASQLGAWISEKWDGIVTATSQAWDNVKKWTSEKWQQAKDTVSNKASEIYSSAKTKFTDVANTVRDKAGNAKDWVAEKWQGMKNGVSAKANEIYASARSRFSDIAATVSQGAGNARDWAGSAFSSLGSRVGSVFGNMRQTASDVFGVIGNWAAELPSKIGRGIQNGISWVSNAIRNVANNLIGPIGGAVNGIINGVNWVLSAVNSNWKLNNWSIPNYAKGTDRHPGGPALVNDAAGSQFREMFMLPDGRMGLFPNERNLLVNLPAGAQVLPGDQVPSYAGGIFGTFKDFFSNGFDKAKGIASDVWNVISNPGILIDKAMDMFVNLGNMGNPMFSMAKGALGMAKDGLFNWVVDMLNGFTGFANGGLVDQFGFYMMAEGNQPEMVVPLSKPELAMQRINEALDFMGFEPEAMTMPEVFNDSSDSYSGALRGGGSHQMSIAGNGMEGLQSGLISSLGSVIANAIMSALQGFDFGGSSDPVEIILEVDSTKLGEVTIKGINKVTKKTGVFPLDI